MGDRAVAAVPRTNVAKDHEGGRAVLPAFTDVGAVSLLANRMEAQLTHQVLEAYIVGSSGRPDFEPRGLSFRERLDPVPTHYLVQRIRHLPVVTVPFSPIRAGAPNLEGAPYEGIAR